ncbi:MAG: ABC transporter permease [Gemmatimonadota bacterium]|nr:ABC transporter permease [Gemmatimonadota bacterium]
MHGSLTYFWRIHLSVLLGVAVATAVLTGALLVGDSVRDSLIDLTLDRLGDVDHALVSERFFRAGLARGIERESDGLTAVPAVNLSGSAVHASAGTRASRVTILGVDSRFGDLFDAEVPGLDRLGAATPFVANESLRSELNARVGDAVLLSFEVPAEVPRESLFGREGASASIQTLRVRLTGVVPDRGMGRFGLRPRQDAPLNAFVSLPVLQEALGLPGRVNMLLVSVDSRGPEDMTQALTRAATLDDLGLSMRVDADHISVESTGYLLKPQAAGSVLGLADGLGMPRMAVLTYLANTIRVGNRELPYSTIAAMDAERVGSLRLAGGPAAPAPGEGEVLLNAWAAADLHAETGDTAEVAYFEAGPKGALNTRRAVFRVAGVVAMDGLGADSLLTPAFPGLHDAEDMHAWDPPFPVDLKRIRPADEAYWDAYRAAPKAIVSSATGQRLWRSRFGTLTSIRLGPAPGMDVRQSAGRFRSGIRDAFTPESAGLVFQPVRVQGLAASSGSTDFGGLFVGFSLFLIVSAALLVGLLFRLGVEQRAGEVGLLMASGFTSGAIRGRFMREAVWLSGFGGVIGLAGGLAYGWIMIAGLRTWWAPAVGTGELALHVHGSSLAAGYLISQVVVLFAILMTVRRLGRLPVRALLSGTVHEAAPGGGRRTRACAIGSLGLAAACLAGASGAGREVAIALFFGCGTFLLISGMGTFAVWLHGSRRAAAPGIWRMGVRNSARNPGRSLLCASLIASACFVVVAVGAHRRIAAGADALNDRTSGGGGFQLVAETDLPLYHDFNSEEGRFELGFSAGDAGILDGARVMPLRVLPGEDVSCLNLYRPRHPRVLGVPEAMIGRGGFSFDRLLEDTDEPWTLLTRHAEPDVIPAFGDANSVTWILHRKLGDEIPIRTDTGEVVRLRLVGLLKNSIFQSELLVSESNFTAHFPDRGGYGYFLIETDRPRELGALLERRLRDAGLDATTASARLARFRTVENTYLSTFQTLGGLGVLLGTFGLGIVMVRNVIERRTELAAMRALGFRRSSLSGLLFVENGFLMATGMAIGVAAAVVTTVPHASGGGLPWTSLMATLGLILGAGLAAGAAGIFAALKTPLLPALKREGA